MNTRAMKVRLMKTRVMRTGLMAGLVSGGVLTKALLLRTPLMGSFLNTRELAKARWAEELQAQREAEMRSQDPAHAALVERMTKAMELPRVRRRRRAKKSVWAVSIVKNEADIIVPVVEHLFRQGVDGMLIADNGSTDGTRELLDQLAQRHRVYLGRDHEKAQYQAIKVGLLCDWARMAGADWIIPVDADEFWFAPGATLKDYLGACECDVVRAAIHNLFPAAGVELGQGPWRLEMAPHQLEKVAFRSHEHALLQEGSHGVHRPGPTSCGLRVLHVPWRSYQQFRRKGQQGGEARALTDLHPNLGYHLRMLGSLGEEAARLVWDGIVNGGLVDDICWSPGGPEKLVDPLTWQTWDPDGVLTQQDAGAMMDT